MKTLTLASSLLFILGLPACDSGDSDDNNNKTQADSGDDDSASPSSDDDSASPSSDDSADDDSDDGADDSGEDDDSDSNAEAEGSGESGEEGEDESESGEETPPPFGSEEDVQRATELWSQLTGYRDWGSFEGHGDIVASNAPHGAFVRILIDETAAADTTDLADGSIVLKENFSEEDEETLAAITVMQKIDGYSPDAGDWFWVKYSPDGSIDENPDGIPLAGRVGLNAEAGCIACHNAAGDDLLFSN